MKTLASSLTRIWSANNRVPRLTGRGTPGPQPSSTRKKRAAWVLEKFLELLELARLTAPTVIAVTLNIFR